MSEGAQTIAKNCLQDLADANEFSKDPMRRAAFVSIFTGTVLRYFCFLPVAKIGKYLLTVWLYAALTLGIC